MSKGKLENYDPASLFDASSLVRSEIYSFDDEAGREITYIPGKPGEKEPEEIRTSVRRAYMAFRQAEEWARAQPREVSDEEALELARELYQDIYLTVSKNCFRIYLARVEEGGDDTAKERQALAELQAKPDFNQQLLAAQESWVDKLILKMGEREAAERAQESVRDARLYIDKHLMSAAIMESEEELPQDADEAVWFQTLDRNFRAETEKSTEYFYKGYVQSQVRGILEGTYKPTEMPLKQLGQLAGLGWLEKQDGPDKDLTILTSKLMGHQSQFLVSKREHLLEELQTRKNQRGELLRARSRLDFPSGMEKVATTQLLEKMQKTLLKHKEESASLLKTHLYLVHRAYKRGGDKPTFIVNMDELLEAKGYTRRTDGSFQTSTYREEWGRILTLTGCKLEVGRITEKNKRGKLETYIAETPYWKVEAQLRLDEGMTQSSIFNLDRELPVIKQAVIEPGAWWAVSDRGSTRLHLPFEILALQTDGNGNESQRMAIQLGAILALWVRSSQNQHAGKAVSYSVGTLLEAAGLKTFDEFQADRPDAAKRLRRYFAGTESEPSGALHHLTNLNAFDIRIRDEGEFWASGRAWQTRFWESMLTVQIPNLAIEKSPKPKAVKPQKHLS